VARNSVPARVLVCVFALLQCTETPINAQSAPAEEHLNKGYELSQKGDLTRAEAELREALKLAPDASPALAVLGAILTRQEKPEEASIYLERALKFDPGLLGTRFNLALNEFRLGKLDPAKTNLDLVLKQKPDHAPAALLLGTILQKLNDCSRAITLLESVAELARRQPDSITALARCYYSGGHLDKARATLGWLSTIPAGPEVKFEGALTAFQSGDFETAEAILTTIQSAYPDKTRLAYTMALIQYNEGRFAKSQSTLEELIIAGTRDANAYDLLAWCHHRQNRLPEAEQAMDEAIQLDPAGGLRYAHLAQILLEEKSYADAYQAARNAAEFPGAGYPAYKVRGDAEAALGLWRQAEVSYARAAELNPQDPEALLLLGMSQGDLLKYQQAKGTFEKGIRLFPNNARFYLAYGKMLLDPGSETDPAAQGAAAVSLLEQALSRDSSLSEAHYELGRQLLRTDRVEQALEHLRAAAQLNPSNSQIRLALANAYRAMGRVEDASEQLRLFKSLQAEGK